MKCPVCHKSDRVIFNRFNKRYKCFKCKRNWEVSKILEIEKGNIQKSPLGTYSEEVVAIKVGGKRIGGSGNKWYAKGDISTKTHLIEVKSTDKDSLSIKLKWLIKIKREAAMVDRIPALIVCIKNEKWVMTKL